MVNAVAKTKICGAFELFVFSKVIAKLTKVAGCDNYVTVKGHKTKNQRSQNYDLGRLPQMRGRDDLQLELIDKLARLNGK